MNITNKDNTLLMQQHDAYNGLLLDFCQNTLMHLFLSIAENAKNKYVSSTVRNGIIKKYIQCKFKKCEFKLIKTELKHIIIMCKKKQNVEKLINSTINHLKIYKSKNKYIDLLALHLREVCNKFNFEIEFLPEDSAKYPSMFVLNSELNGAFDNQGVLKSDVYLYVDNEHAKTFLEYIPKEQNFKVQECRSNSISLLSHTCLALTLIE